jgi:endo-1,4-beta-xylanase
MTHKLKPVFAVAAMALLAASCLKQGPKDVGVSNLGNFADNSMALKDAAEFPMGVAISATPFLQDAGYSGVAKRDFDEVVFEYQMKHGAIVQDNGTLNFTNTDALVNAVGTQNIFGHTLAWHANQNGTYLRNFSGITVPAATENLSNAGFENGLTGWSALNTGNPAGSATITTTRVASEIRSGTTAMKVINPTAYPGSQWRVQVASILVPTTVGTQYTISYYVKAAAAGGSIRLSTSDQSGANAQYQGDQNIGTTFSQVSWTITANSAQTRFLFDMGQAANTYFIDDASFKQVVVPAGGPQIASKLDAAMESFITGIVTKYKGKVRAWDVVNEAISPSGALRTRNNSTDMSDVDKNQPDKLFWADYMGRDYPYRAFVHAKAADPTAEFYINDFGLENSVAKTDSLVALVNELKARGAKVDGIGTQMHLDRLSINYAGIDRVFKKLASTGLKVRLSELDVRIMQGSAAGKTLTPELANFQAEIIRYVVSSYMKNVPAAQRAGITVWGVNDKNSWMSNNGAEFPLLYDDNYQKKPAYGAVLQGLKQQ